MSLLICKNEGSSDVAENVDEKLPNRAWPKVHQSQRGLAIYIRIVPSSIGVELQNLLYPDLFLLIFWEGA